MNFVKDNKCPLCGERLHTIKLACPNCKTEFPINTELSRFDYLNKEQVELLIAFLRCEGKINEVGKLLGISYPTVKRRFYDLLEALDLEPYRDERNYSSCEEIDEIVDYDEFMEEAANTVDPSQIRASEIVRKKLKENNGIAHITLQSGIPCTIRMINPAKFESDKLGIQTLDFSVFDIIVDFLKEVGGEARKGAIRGPQNNVGKGNCTPDTVMFQIATKYYGKNYDETAFDPLFVLAAVLEWAGICENGRGYLKLI